MLGHRELTMEDYADILKRRSWLILASAIICFVVGVVVSHIIPPQYQSQTLILIEQQKIPEDYVKPVIEEDLSSRLASMKEQILSRSRIEPIIRRFNLFADGKATMDDRVTLTQKAIGVKPIPSGQSGGMPGFYVTFKAQDARTAQQVCGEITTLFVSENLSAREETAVGTNEFLKQQLSDSKQNLDQQDAKLAAFQQKYFGRLPEQEQSNSNTLQALTTQLDAATQAVNRQQQNVTFLQAMVSQQTHDLQSAEPIANAALVDERKNELRALIKQKQALQAQYTPDHPDVVEVSRKIADLQAQIAHTSTEPAVAPVAATINRPDPPQLQQLKAQLHAAQQALEDSKHDQARVVQQVRGYEARIEASPQIEQEYKQITRDHETALEFYNSLLKKMNESSMATALERRQQGEQFRVMDAPNLPDAPIFPNRLKFAIGGLAAGLFLGFLLAGLLEYRDTSLRNERDVWAFTKLSTLASISYIDGLPQPEEAHSRWKLFSRTNKMNESALG
ncbi:MAG: Wzz/FepE/Etk N-terminal domain-containing protein [Acidobacteriaceae bacterium]|nr:Wzz/FepE/Etk N-terminal domain-containing protein [Acidobacteriaceae bacterium]